MDSDLERIANAIAERVKQEDDLVQHLGADSPRLEEEEPQADSGDRSFGGEEVGGAEVEEEEVTLGQVDSEGDEQEQGEVLGEGEGGGHEYGGLRITGIFSAGETGEGGEAGEDAGAPEPPRRRAQPIKRSRVRKVRRRKQYRFEVRIGRRKLLCDMASAEHGFLTTEKDGVKTIQPIKTKIEIEDFEPMKFIEPEPLSAQAFGGFGETFVGKVQRRVSSVDGDIPAPVARKQVVARHYDNSNDALERLMGRFR